jgi:hypothetical protein
MHTTRNSKVDGLKFLAIFFMLASHSARLSHPQDYDAFRTLALLIEPITQMLFLGLAGLSLGYSLQKSEHTMPWFIKTAKRALLLIFISFILFFFERGFYLQWILWGTGYLATIGWSLFITSGLYVLGRGWGLFYGLLILLLSFLALEFLGHRILGLNAGNAPLLPFMLFTLLGLGLHFIYNGSPLSLPKRILTGFSALLVLIFPMVYGLRDLLGSSIGRNIDGVVFRKSTSGIHDLFNPSSILESIAYFNMTPLLTLFLMSLLVTITYWCSIPSQKRLPAPLQFFTDLSAHSLLIYIFHLVVLAALYSLDNFPLHTALYYYASLVLMLLTAKGLIYLLQKLRSN